MLAKPAFRSKYFITFPVAINNLPDPSGIGGAVDNDAHVFVHSEECPVYQQAIRHMDTGHQQIKQDDDADSYLQYHPPGFN